MLPVPAEKPDTNPEPDTVATEVLPLVHIPPPTASLKARAVPVQTTGEPDIAEGVMLTVTGVVTEQPLLPNV
jgi:hypothetical protein